MFIRRIICKGTKYEVSVPTKVYLSMKRMLEKDASADNIIQAIKALRDHTSLSVADAVRAIEKEFNVRLSAASSKERKCEGLRVAAKFILQTAQSRSEEIKSFATFVADQLNLFADGVRDNRLHDDCIIIREAID